MLYIALRFSTIAIFAGWQRKQDRTSFFKLRPCGDSYILPTVLCCGGVMRYLYVLIALMFGNAAMAVESDISKRTIQVVGEAELRVAPNEAVVSMSVQSRDAALVVAKKRVDDSVRNVLTLLKDMGIKPAHVQTDFIEVAPTYLTCNNDDRRSGVCDPTKTDYYDVKTGLVVRLQDLKLFDKVISEALQNGVTYIENVQFLTTDMRKYRDQARDLAIKAAKEKAEAVAGALGQKVGRPIMIAVNSNNGMYYGYYGRRGGAIGQTQNIMMESSSNNGFSNGGIENASSLGQIKIDANITVNFELQ